MNRMKIWLPVMILIIIIAIVVAKCAGSKVSKPEAPVVVKAIVEPAVEPKVPEAKIIIIEKQCECEEPAFEESIANDPDLGTAADEASQEWLDKIKADNAPIMEAEPATKAKVLPKVGDPLVTDDKDEITPVLGAPLKSTTPLPVDKRVGPLVERVQAPFWHDKD